VPGGGFQHGLQCLRSERNPILITRLIFSRKGEFLE
jgi:hypothetical protein